RYGADKAEIRLEYDRDGRLSAARGGKEEVTFSYAEGRLSGVTRGKDRLAYEYKDGQLSQVKRDGKVVRSFTYHPGRLAAESGEGGKTGAYAGRTEGGRAGGESGARGQEETAGEADAVPARERQ